MVIPPSPCILPKRPVPLKAIDPWDCDGDGPGTDICWTEEDMKVTAIFLIQLVEWAKLAEKCPGTQIEKNAVPFPASLPSFVEETKEII